MQYNEYNDFNDDERVFQVVVIEWINGEFIESPFLCVENELNGIEEILKGAKKEYLVQEVEV